MAPPIDVAGGWLRRSTSWRLPVAAALGIGLFCVSLSAHLKRACTVMDTPYLPLCEAPEDQAAKEQELRARIVTNPGDAWAWTQLLVAGGDAPDDGLLRGATGVAPNHPNVLRWRAAKAFERGQDAEGVEVLVQMVAKRESVDAARTLARYAATPGGLAVLRPHLAQAEEWLPQVLAQVTFVKLPPGYFLPLVVEAVQAGTLPESARIAYMRSLKGGGHWLDAYGLWLAHHRDTVPLLYNASFDLPLEGDGFDWEFAPVARSRAGFVVGQSAIARRGLVLDIEFTGRRFASPIVRQYVFAPEGAYRLVGEYTSTLRSESGLAWVVACTGGAKAEAGRSATLAETGGAWRRFQLDFTIPANCGAVASLQLEPEKGYEAAAGLRGRFSADAFSLTRTAH